MQISNITYPTDNITNYKNNYGDSGFNSNFENTKNGYAYKKSSLESNGTFLTIDKSVKKNLSIFSTKINELLLRVRKSNGIVYIYSRYIHSGIIPLILALEQNGYSKYNAPPILNLPEWDSTTSRYKKITIFLIVIINFKKNKNNI